MNQIKRIYYYVKKKIEIYQDKSDMKKHLKYLFILLLLTCGLKFYLSYILHGQIFNLKSIFQAEKVIQDNQQTNDDPIDNEISTNQQQQQIQSEKLSKFELIMMIIDQLLHLLMSLEILSIIFLITLIVNKKKEQPLNQILLIKESSENLCSIQIIGSSPNFPSVRYNGYESGFSSYEMQTLSRQKPQKKNVLHSIEENNKEAFPSENLIKSTSQIKSTDQIKSTGQIKSTNQITMEPKELKLIRCNKEYCNFFWLSNVKNSEYFCLNCDQNNVIEKQNSLVIKQRQKQVIPINIQIYSIKNQIVNLVIECVNYEFCGFFWIYDNKYDNSNQYCPICDQNFQKQQLSYHKYYHSSSTYQSESVKYQCCYCKIEAEQFYQTSCLHIYHFSCLNEFISNQNLVQINCIICKNNLFHELIVNQLIHQNILNKIYQNQLKEIIKQFT